MKQTIEKQGHIVNLFEAVTAGQEFAENCDMIGVFYPVWGSNMPDPVRDKMNQLKDGQGKKIFLVGNCAVFTGDTGMYWKKILEKKGYDAFYKHKIMISRCNVFRINWRNRNILCTSEVDLGAKND